MGERRDPYGIEISVGMVSKCSFPCLSSLKPEDKWRKLQPRCTVSPPSMAGL